MKTGDKTRALAEFAFFTSLAAIIGLAGIYLAPLFFIAALFFPIPFILLVLKLDARHGVLGLVAAGLVMFAFVREPEAALVLIVQYGLLGILYGLLIKNHISSGATLAAGLAGSTVLAFFSAVLLYAVTGQNPLALDQATRQLVAQMVAANQDAGALTGLPPQMQENFAENMSAFLELFMPGQLIISSAAAAALTFFLARVNLRFLGLFLPLPVFTRLFFPWHSVWGLIAGLALTLVGDQFALTWAAQVGKNILFVLFYAYLVLGLSVATYFFRRISMARPIKIIFLILAFVYLPFSTAIVTLIGVADPLVNLRRLPAGKE